MKYRIFACKTVRLAVVMVAMVLAAVLAVPVAADVVLVGSLNPGVDDIKPASSIFGSGLHQGVEKLIRGGAYLGKRCLKSWRLL